MTLIAQTISFSCVNVKFVQAFMLILCITQEYFCRPLALWKFTEKRAFEDTMHDHDGPTTTTHREQLMAQCSGLVL